jgi:hypothetical protein
MARFSHVRSESYNQTVAPDWGAFSSRDTKSVAGAPLRFDKSAYVKRTS